MVWAEIGTLVGIPIVRSVTGWLENSLEDGLIDKFEWSKLGGTIFRVGAIGFGLFFGLDAFGFDVSALAASGSAVVIDFILGALKSRR